MAYTVARACNYRAIHIVSWASYGRRLYTKLKTSRFCFTLLVVSRSKQDSHCMQVSPMPPYVCGYSTAHNYDKLYIMGLWIALSSAEQCLHHRLHVEVLEVTVGLSSAHKHNGLACDICHRYGSSHLHGCRHTHTTCQTISISFTVAVSRLQPRSPESSTPLSALL